MKYFVSFAAAVILVFSAAVCSYAAEPAPNASVSGIHDLYQAVKNIFVPREDYFYNHISVLNELAQSRFGGMAQLYYIFHDFFTELHNARSSGLVLSIPAGFFAQGQAAVSVDLLQLSVVRPFVGLVYNAVNVAVCLVTASIAYNKLRDFFTV